ncbi:MAG TPA: anti-sigma factor [Gemmatimonadales bacterium]
MRTHDWFVEHRLEYATRTLDGDDARSFEAHLADCDACREEVARAEHDLRWFAMGLPPAMPSRGLTRRIVNHVLQGERARPQRWRMPAAIAAATVLAVGGWYLGRAGALRRELAGQRVAVAALQDTLSIMRQANRILQANVDVDGARGGLLIFADEATHRWNVVVHGLPPAPTGRHYQFWFICGESADSMVRGTEVPVDERRPTMFATDMPEPQSCRSVLGAALTEEPASESTGPPRGKPLAHLML